MPKRLFPFFFRTDPIRSYEAFFNVYAIKTVSKESGAIHACNAVDCPEEHHEIVYEGSNKFPRNAKVPAAKPSTIFGSSFDNGNIHRLVVPQNQELIGEILRSHVLKHDMVLILVNSPYYGGSGGRYATSTVNMASNEIAIHEIGHSFAKLGDEYWAGNQYAYESPNRTRISDVDKIAWRYWIGTDGIGVYSYGNQSSKSNWYRPHEFCKMQTLKAPFCKVCQEQFVRKIHELTSPILRKTPNSDTVARGDSVLKYSVDLVLPFPNTLKVSWLLQGELIASSTSSLILDPVMLSPGNNVLELIVQDTTALVRNPAYKNSAVYVERWNIEGNSISQVSVPKITWKDSLQTCYGTSQVINVEMPVAGAIYHWYDKEEGGECLATGTTFYTPLIFEDKTYYVDAEVDGKRSARKAVHIVLLSSLQINPGVKIIKNRKLGRYVVSLVNDQLRMDEKYIWTRNDGIPLKTWDTEKAKYIYIPENSDTVILDGETLRNGIYVKKVNKSTTCLGDNYFIDFHTSSK